MNQSLSGFAGIVADSFGEVVAVAMAASARVPEVEEIVQEMAGLETLRESIQGGVHALACLGDFSLDGAVGRLGMVFFSHDR
jgi:hypothetical protein